MTIASALENLNTDITNARTAITTKGGTVTVNGGSSQLATDIATIPTGGGGSAVITSLTVTPTTSQQTIIAPSGTDGYNPITVNAVTSSIDSNITAGNIKNGVSILGVSGTYSGTTPTGTKNIYSNGTYDVTNYASANVSVANRAEGNLGYPTYKVYKDTVAGYLIFVSLFDNDIQQSALVIQVNATGSQTSISGYLAHDSGMTPASNWGWRDIFAVPFNSNIMYKVTEASLYYIPELAEGRASFKFFTPDGKVTCSNAVLYKTLYFGETVNTSWNDNA